MGGSVRATAHKHTLCTRCAQTHYLVTKPGPRCDEVDHALNLQTNRPERAPSIRPSDFDLILTHDVGQYVNSRTCVSEGLSAPLAGPLQHYLPTAAVAVRTMSIISIQRMRPASTAVWTLGEAQNSSTSAPSSVSLALAFFRARFSAAGDTQ